MWTILDIARDYLNKLDDNTEEERIVASAIKRELKVLEHTRPNIDISGTLEELEKRLNDKVFFIVDRKEYMKIRNKALKYNVIREALLDE